MSYESTILAKSPVCYWRLEEAAGAVTVIDQVGTKNLNCNGSVTLGVEGLISGSSDSCASFSGETATASFIATNFLAFPTIAIGVEFLIKTPQQSGIKSIFSYANSSYVNAFAIVNGATLKVYVNDEEVDTGVFIGDDVAHHVAVGWRSSTGVVEVFVDGAKRFVGFASQGQNLEAAGTLVIGQLQTVVGGGFNADNAFEGLIDEIAIYDDAIAEDDLEVNWIAAQLSEVASEPCNCPTLEYPNGGEEIADRSIIVTWHSPQVKHPSNFPVWYELFFTDFYNGDDTNWLQVATLPSTEESFVLQLPRAAISNRCRVGIRCRDHRGIRSQMDVSAGDFSVLRRQLKPPVVISPIDGASYRSVVPIILDFSGTRGTLSQRATFEVFYSSSDNGIDWTAAFYDQPADGGPVYWDVSELPAGAYVVRIRLVDDEGNSSVSVFIRDIILSPTSVNLFYIDTTPPRGVVEIQNNADYIRVRNLVLRLTAFDETTAVASVVLKESIENEDGELEDIITTVPQPMSSIKTFILAESDGLRYVQAVYADVAGNSPAPSVSASYFREFLNRDAEIGAITSQTDGDLTYLWTAFNGDDHTLYRDRERFLDLSYDVSAMAVYDGSLYLGSVTTAGKGILHKLEGEELLAITTFTDFDSAISAMAEFNGNLYFALENKKFYVYDGTSVSLITTLDNRVNAMFAEGKYLFIFEDLTTDIALYDGTSFTTLTVTNAYQQI